MGIVNWLNFNIEKYKNRKDPFYIAFKEQDDELICQALQDNQELFVKENVAFNFAITAINMLLAKTFTYLINHENFKMNEEQKDNLLSVIVYNLPNQENNPCKIINEENKEQRFAQILNVLTNRYPGIMTFNHLVSMLIAKTPVEVFNVATMDYFQNASLEQKVNIVHTVHSQLLPEISDQTKKMEAFKNALNPMSHFNMNYQAIFCDFIKNHELITAEEFSLMDEDNKQADLFARMVNDLLIDTIAYRKMTKEKGEMEPVNLIRHILGSGKIPLNSLKITRNTSATSGAHPQLDNLWDELILPVIDLNSHNSKKQSI
jgi:hypothetical protein